MKKRTDFDTVKIIFDLNLIASVLALEFDIVSILACLVNFASVIAYSIEYLTLIKGSTQRKRLNKICLNLSIIYTIIFFISMRWHAGCMCNEYLLYKLSILVYLFLWLPFLIVLRKKCLKAVSSEKKLSFLYLIVAIIIGFIAASICGYHISAAHTIYPS